MVTIQRRWRQYYSWQRLLIIHIDYSWNIHKNHNNNKYSMDENQFVRKSSYRPDRCEIPLINYSLINQSTKKIVCCWIYFLFRWILINKLLPYWQFTIIKKNPTNTNRKRRHFQSPFCSTKNIMLNVSQISVHPLNVCNVCIFNLNPPWLNVIPNKSKL